MKPRIASLLVSVALLAALSPGASAQKYPSGYIKGSSDWWSILNKNFRTPVADPQGRSFALSNLEIAGQAFSEDDIFGLGDPFDRIFAKLGKAPVTERGDASTGRFQLCYTSARRPGTMYLVFETGEEESSFYLFVDGAPWKGRNRCVKSTPVSPALATGSGLHLGMTPGQVEAILGKPTLSSIDRLIYWGTSRHKTSLDVLNKLKMQDPKMSDAELQRNFGYYDLTVYIEARFSSEKLAYLVVSRQ